MDCHEADLCVLGFWLVLVLGSSSHVCKGELGCFTCGSHFLLWEEESRVGTPLCVARSKLPPWDSLGVRASVQLGQDGGSQSRCTWWHLFCWQPGDGALN